MNYYHNIEGEQISPMVLPTASFTGDQLFSVRDTPDAPGTHAMATIRVDFRPTPGAAHVIAPYGHSGPGLYGCFWDGMLFYVGTFAGNQRPMQGNVARERWTKHIAGMTFRGRTVTISEAWLETIAQDHDSALARLLIAADRTRIAKTAGSLQTQYRKFLFADRHWPDFALLDDAMLARFAFVYLRPSLHGRLAAMDKAALDPHLRSMERAVIARLAPPCNGHSPIPDDDGGPDGGGIATLVGIADATRVMRQEMDAHLANVQGDHPDYRLQPRKSRTPTTAR